MYILLILIPLIFFYLVVANRFRQKELSHFKDVQPSSIHAWQYSNFLYIVFAQEIPFLLMYIFAQEREI